MKTLRFTLLLSFFVTSLFAQKRNDGETTVIQCIGFSVTRPISEIFKEHPVDENFMPVKGESEDREHRTPQRFKFTVKDGPQYGNDEKTIQREMGTVPGRAPIVNWAGQTASGFRPMDPSGAAGPNHYVQMINSTTFRVYNKSTGANMLTATLGNLWSPATANDGDPIVMYDKAADRWFLSQFGQTGNRMYIAISTSSDPTGSYYTYTFSSSQFPDYLKFSVWADGYYMTSNQTTQKVFVFERDKMLVGNAAARAISVNYSPPKSGFFCPLPGDAADGTLPTVGTPCPIFSYSDNGWGGTFVDAINIYNMSVNWVPATPTATITLAANLSPAAFDASYDSQWNDVSQPGTTQKLDGIGGVFMYRAQWKNWSGYNTIVLNWAVKISASQRSIKWCELRQNQSTGVWSIYQEGVYTPDAATRWMGGIAMDNNGSIGLSYMKSDATSIFPGVYYTGRRSCDPLGTLPITESVVIAGSGSQTGINRDGDYAHTALDPDGITFWHTSEYMGSGGVAQTRIFSYQIPSCDNQAIVNIALTAGTNPMCTGASATFTATPTNGGTTPVYQWKVNGTNVGTNSTTYTTSTLTNGQVVTCVMTSNLPGVTGNPATSNAITMTVNPIVTPSVSIALTTGSNPACSGSTLIFTATPTNGGASPSYQWKVNGTNAGTNSSTFTTTSLTNGQTVTCVLTTSAPCATVSTATSNGITMTINPQANPSVSIAQTSGTNPQCSGASATFTATVTNGSSPTYQWKVNGTNAGTNSSTFTTSSLTNGQAVTCDVTATAACPVITTVTLGTGSTTNATTGTTADLGNAYPTWYGNGRQQYLVRASELTALGLPAGNITSLGFNTGAATGDPATLNGYTIKLATTASTISTTTFFSPAFTTVFGPINYTPTVNATNTHNFASPFSWNGSSNLIIDICFSNQVVGNGAYQCYLSTSSFVSTTYYQADGASGAGACTQTTGTTGSTRPNMIFKVGSSSPTVSSNSITMTVNSSVAPSVSIAQTSGTNPQCAGASATFTATPTNGGASPSYQWKVNGTNAGTNSSTFTSSSLTNGQSITCVLTSNLACASPTTATSGGITMTVNANVTPSVSISQTGGTNPQCAGAFATFTATPTNGGASPSYQWKVNGTNSGTNSTTFTTSSLTNGQVITCVLTSNATCASPTTATSGGITMTVNPNVTPSVSISQTGGTNPQCAGATAVFTATPTNGGASPTYQWKVNGTNVGTNSTTFTSASLTNGQSVTCQLTSNAACASPATATSGGITMVVNPTVSPSVSISQTSGNNPQCSGESVGFTATPVNGGGSPSYQWKVDGTNAGTNSATFSTSALTNGQVVSCLLTSNATCANPLSAASGGITMIVNPNVIPSISILQTGGTNPQCEGASAAFTATISDGGSSPSYQWKVDGSDVGSNNAAFTTALLTDGQVVSCVLTSNQACASPATATSGGITMSVNPNVAPGVSIALTDGNNPQCSGESATFTATPVNGGATPSYLWLIDGLTTGQTGETFTASLGDGQEVSCRMTSSAECTVGNPATSNSITMTVSSVITASVSISANPGNIICEGASVTFNASANAGSPSYQWKLNGNDVGTDNDSYTTSTINDGDVVTCEMSSSAGCVTGSPATSNEITMTVNPPVSPSVSFDADPGSTICEGTSVTFTAIPVNGGTTPAYQWKNGTTVVGSGPSYTTSNLLNGDDITCEMTSSEDCVSGPAVSSVITMTVNPAVTAGVTISADPGNQICEGTSVTFTAVLVNGGITPAIKWEKNDITVETGSLTFTTSALADGDVITCEVTSDETCVVNNPATSSPIVMDVTSPPQITSFSPAIGSDGTPVTISGSSFNGTTDVSFNGIAASFTVTNDNQIAAVAPAGVTTGLISVTTSCGTGSSSVNFNVASPVTLDLRVLIEGFYIGNGQMTEIVAPGVCDTLVVGLADPVSPYSIQHTFKGTINTSGNGSFVFPSSVMGNSYYVVVLHRNTLETWSDAPVSFATTNVSYDFTNALNKAYGDDLVGVDGLFAIRSGDVNQDGIINMLDIDNLEMQTQLFSSGYISEDLTGDNLVEAEDYSLIENNLAKVRMRP